MSNIYCLGFQVQPKHVKEAFRLLGKSIIRVEQPDIHLEEDEEPEEPAVEVEGTDRKKILSSSQLSKLRIVKVILSGHVRYLERAC